jgi:lipopolysaccharide export system protein LptA
MSARRFPFRRACLALSLVALSAPAFAQGAAKDPVREQQKAAVKAQQQSAPGGLGSMNSKEPIKIDADRLDVFDKESRAVFAGNVVAVQGETTVRCTVMTLFYEPRGQNRPGQAAAAPATQPAAQRAAAAPGQNDGAIRRIECTGPVTVISKTQTATGDNAVFDRVTNKVILTGNVALADGQNITRGEKLVYDTQTGVANVETTPGGRVKGLFIPGSGAQSPGGGTAPSAGAKPAAGTSSAPAPRPRPQPSTPTN